MSKSRFIKLSGWAFVLGSVAFIAILFGSIAGSVIGAILIAIGMVGLRVRYGKIVGSLGRNVLMIGIVGMVLTYIAIAFPLSQDVEILYLLPYAGPAVLLIGLTVFGLVALYKKPLPYANWLPLVAAVWYPFIYFSIFFYIITNNGAWPENDLPYVLIQNTLLLEFFALCILGLILQSDVIEDTKTSQQGQPV